MRCGYHGWHDWCVEMKGGIPSKFYEDVFEFPYNRLDKLEELMAAHGKETAAIIMTPFGHPNHEEMQEPNPGFLQGVRDLADKYGAVLVYDEIRTAFRLRMGGAQELYGVTPDLTVLGKAIANGYPISVVTGKKDVMSAAGSKLFISSTFFPEQRRVCRRAEDHRNPRSGTRCSRIFGKRASASSGRSRATDEQI